MAHFSLSSSDLIGGSSLPGQGQKQKHFSDFSGFPPEFIRLLVGGNDGRIAD